MTQEKWRPIKSAPKDGTVLLVNDTTETGPPWCASYFVESLEWSGWVYDDELLNDHNPLGPEPTHYMLIDPPPCT